MRKIIFTDLDGTFLNHDNYEFKESLEARTYIKEKKIPLIFTTSKTKKEVELLQKKTGISEPFITENGAALFIPKNYDGLSPQHLKSTHNYYIIQLGVSYDEVIEFYNLHKEKFELLGFSDMSPLEVAQETGLPLEGIELTKNRDFTEPFIIKDETKIPELEVLAHKSGIKITKGGRFYHLIGINQDKGKAVQKCIEFFEEQYKTTFTSIGLGDGNNDIPLLQNVSIPIAIKNHHDEYIEVNNVQKSTYKGAKGWNEMILKNL